MNLIALIILFLQVSRLKASLPCETGLSNNINNETVESTSENLISAAGSEDYSCCEEDVEGPYDTSILWGLKPVRGAHFDLPTEALTLANEKISSVSQASPNSVADIADEWDIRMCTVSWIKEHLIPIFERGEMIPKYMIKKIIDEASYLFYLDSSIHYIDVPKDGKVVVVGDIHGQFESTLSIFRDYGYPSKDFVYLFNGDIVDRGDKSLECILMVFAYKIALPNAFFVTRGNHESRTVSKEKFFEECQNKLADYERAFEDFHDAFDSLPYGFVIKNEIFVTHGGLCPGIFLNNIGRLLRRYFNCYNTIEFYSMLWNDPCEADVPVNEFGMAPNSRGPGCQRFSTRVTDRFLYRHKLKLLVRSHQVVPEGAQMSQGNRCVTVFSAPNYRGGNNYGAVLVITETGETLKQMRYFKPRKSSK